MDNLKLFFTKIKELSFWQRIFSWAKVRALSYDAFEEFISLEKNLATQKENFDGINNKLIQISAENDSLSEKIQDLDKLGIIKLIL